MAQSYIRACSTPEIINSPQYKFASSYLDYLKNVDPYTFKIARLDELQTTTNKLEELSITY